MVTWRFLHRFEQSGLGLGGRSVDFVSQQDLGEDRPRHEPERQILRIETRSRPRNVGGHQVRGELNAFHIETQQGAQGCAPGESSRRPGCLAAGRDHRPMKPIKTCSAAVLWPRT